jgi:hypothetical protein
MQWSGMSPPRVLDSPAGLPRRRRTAPQHGDGQVTPTLMARWTKTGVDHEPHQGSNVCRRFPDENSNA